MKKAFYIKHTIFLLLVAVFLVLNSCNNFVSQDNNIIDKSQNTNSSILVHYIDVDQGDCILVQVNSKNLLIDSGSRDQKDNLFSYLKSNDIKKFDYVIATHPHEDHIGNMAQIIKNYDIKYFYAPKITHNSKIFEDMIDELDNNNLKINVIKEGTASINLGKGTRVEVFSPIDDRYDDLNNYSPVIKITYQNISFLFTGDAEKLSEKEIINKNYDLKADVLKIGHHGSSSSTSDDFLNKINPSIAVITVGNDNDYNHPNKEVLDSLNKRSIKTFQTNIDGTIIIISDGTNITTKKSIH